MSTLLFSTHSKAENSVTSTILVVFERISFSLVETILQRLCDETESTLLEFRNQPTSARSTGSSSIPDAVIKGSFGYWIETKIKKKNVSTTQIKNHLKIMRARIESVSGPKFAT